MCQQCYNSENNKADNMVMAKLYTLNAKSDWSKYQSKRVQTISLYNESSQHKEKPELALSDLEKPSLLHFFGVKGTQGGLLLEQLMNNEKYALITFMSLPTDKRGAGLGTQLVEYATKHMKTKGIDLVGAQLNPADPQEFWSKQGFKEQIEFGNGVALILPE